LKGKWKLYKFHNEWAVVKDYDQAMVSGKAGDEAIFNFNGTGVSLVGNWFKDGGKADVFLDGKLVRTINTYFDFSGQQHIDMDLCHFTNLPAGKHELKIIVKGEKVPESAGTKIYLSQAIVFKTEKKKSDTYKFSFE